MRLLGNDLTIIRRLSDMTGCDARLTVIAAAACPALDDAADAEPEDDDGDFT